MKGWSSGCHTGRKFTLKHGVSYSGEKTQAEREAQRRHDEVEAKHPELIRIEREMAEAGHSIVYALGRPDAQSFWTG